MTSRVRFPYTKESDDQDYAQPRLSRILLYDNQHTRVTGLLDTGATVNVLPHSVGLALGAVWERQTDVVYLTGNLGRREARAITISAYNPQLTPGKPVQLIFAWSEDDNTPVIFGHINFFETFNVCFYGKQGVFDLHPITEQK